MVVLDGQRPSGRQWANVTQVWLAAFEVTTLFDRVELTGEAVSADIANGAGAPEAVDLARDALKPSPRIRFGSTTFPESAPA
ncbi:hypothetical protein [Candidatus Palauibacter sp.]|uniref:hypothetical protein n=1 Tax=Candidatus Palauibacter sp. TaxID=3101350 RepID=UPI003B028F8C